MMRPPNLLRKHRLELRLSGAELCRRVGLDESHYSALERGRVSPMGSTKNEWRLGALKLAGFYGVEPEDLFPSTLKRPERLRHADALEFSELCMSNSPDVEEAFDDAWTYVALLKAFSRLTRQQQMLIIQRFGLEGHEEMTLDAIGQGIRLSRERTRQLIARAVSKLRQELEKIDPVWADEVKAARAVAWWRWW